MALEGKVSEAKAKKDMLKAQAQAAKAQAQLQSSIGNMGNTSSAMSAFERMEEKVLELEARSQGMAELGGIDLESRFAALESGSGVDDELAAMKAQLSGGSTPVGALPAGTQSGVVKDAAVDAELEALKNQLDQL